MSTSLVFLSTGPMVAAAGEDGSVQVWDVRTGSQVTAPLSCSKRPSPALALDAKASELLCTDWEESVVRRWDVRNWQTLDPIPVRSQGMGPESRLSADGSMLTIDAASVGLQIVEVRTSAVVGALPAGTAGSVESIAFDPRGINVATVQDGGGPLMIWSWDGHGEARDGRFIETPSLHAVAYSPDGKLLAYAAESGDIVVMDTADPKKSRRFGSYANRIENAGLTPDSSVLAVHVWYDNHVALDLKGGGLLGDGAPVISYDNAGDFAPNGELSGQRFTITNEEDHVRISAPDGRLISTLVVLDKIGAWITIDPTGRFDTNMDLSDIKGVHWIVPGNSLDPLPLEILMRDYYEPRLLPRLLVGAPLANPRPLASLNRVQPEVEIVEVGPGAAPDEVQVMVRVRGLERQFQDRQKPWRSGAYDLRLFRAGQLVGQWPEPGEPELLAGASEADLAEWRATHRVVDGVGTAEIPFRVRLPRRPVGSPVEFTAYAFNADRVKRATASLSYALPETLPPRPRRVYVLAVGVSAYQDPAWNLRYADDDARRLVEVLVPRLEAEHGADNVVAVTLIADWMDDDGDRKARVADATKANIEAALAILAGRENAPDLRSKVARLRDDVPDAARLAKANPEDLVLIAYSSHGYADQAGNFYLFPYDIGADTSRTVTKEMLERAISSAELSFWLRDVDAGELIMVVDACHSAASVESPEFKPGPMGARGLGQLAYDKGMRILASTRADDVAWESPKTKQGLLSYALVQEGLAEGKADLPPADGDGMITLREWLEYPVDRLPALYEEAVARGDVTLAGYDSARSTAYFDLEAIAAEVEAAAGQTPSLFDFRRGAVPDTVVARTTNAVSPAP